MRAEYLSHERRRLQRWRNITPTRIFSHLSAAETHQLSSRLKKGKVSNERLYVAEEKLREEELLFALDLFSCRSLQVQPHLSLPVGSSWRQKFLLSELVWLLEPVSPLQRIQWNSCNNLRSLWPLVVFLLMILLAGWGDIRPSGVVSAVITYTDQGVLKIEFIWIISVVIVNVCPCPSESLFLWRCRRPRHMTDVSFMVTLLLFCVCAVVLSVIGSGLERPFCLSVREQHDVSSCSDLFGNVTSSSTLSVLVCSFFSGCRVGLHGPTEPVEGAVLPPLIPRLQCGRRPAVHGDQVWLTEEDLVPDCWIRFDSPL